ncbi:hypothetical protein Taro_049352 [Colocasia esculenta]|uniref:Bromo domain-containing protein n=1 Tax=Colocasia esculenta TaxID=4460 RepID=A0A843XAM3_COLES|nr:hypothetical protein [Colocasia esculenta]
MGKQVEKKRKKKGRPSLLDLQRRSLRLQKQQRQQQQQQQQQTKKAASSPSPNPYLRFPAGTPARRASRRNPSPEPDGDDDDEEAGGKRREKKLKLVLRLHQGDGDCSRSADGNPSASELSGSESNGEGGAEPKKRKIDAIGGEEAGPEKTERHNHAPKTTDPLQGGPSDSGPTTTPLPDEKLLLFVLDRLQKKDSYGVFSEPVDPDELPDYRDIIEHPMDFSTVRKRLSTGYYANLEMFEEDVFLICSNAMRYNAPDTIYFRQARSIQELAKKNFENLRQESSDDEEPEPKVVRRGRPPSKNTTKKAVGRPPAEHASSDFSSGATLANAGESTLLSNSSHDLTRKGFSFDKLGSHDASARASHGLRNNESYNWMADKTDRNEESGSVKGILMRFGKKVTVLDENRRNTYRQSQSSMCWQDASVLSAFDGERRELLPIGIHIEHAYARSLARFAANLGPVGWGIAAKQIEKLLPPGTKFGHGWVGEPDITHRCQTPLLSASPPLPCPQRTAVLSKADGISEQLESPSTTVTVQGGHLIQTTAFASSSNISSRSSNTMEGAQAMRQLNSESSTGMGSGSGGVAGMRPKAPFQLHQKMAVHPGINGFSNSTFGFDLSQVVKMVSAAMPSGNFMTQVPMTHARALDMVSRGDNNFFHPASVPHKESARQNSSNPGAINSVDPLPSCSQDLHSGSWRESSLRPNPDSTPPPDLNLRFQSAGSSPSNAVIDSQQQPDLALQL